MLTASLQLYKRHDAARLKKRRSTVAAIMISTLRHESLVVSTPGDLESATRPLGASGAASAVSLTSHFTNPVHVASGGLPAQNNVTVNVC